MTIRELAAGLVPGQSRSGLLCPGCGGGRTGERTLSVWRDDAGVGYKCHRASCKVSGVRGAYAGPAVVATPWQPRPYPYDLITPPLTSPLWGLLNYPVPLGPARGILAAELGVWANANDSQELVWEVRDYGYMAKGHVSRTYPGKFVRTWKTEPGPFYAYMGWVRKPALFIVEDMVSAARIMLEGGTSLALLGTHFSAEGRGELKSFLERYPETKVRIALDPDAYEKGARLARELTFQLGRDILSVPVGCDPKDMSPEQLRGIINDG